jgi:hypothetical protein
MTQMVRKLIITYAVNSAIALAIVPCMAHAQLLSPQWPPEQRARFLALGRAQWSLDQTCNTMIAFTGTLESDAFFANFNGTPARVGMANDFEAWKQDDAHGLGAKHPSSVFNWSICKGNPVAAVMFALPPAVPTSVNTPPPPTPTQPFGPAAFGQTIVSPPVTAMEVPIYPLHGTNIVPVTVNGSLTRDFTLDSGAATVVIPPSIARELRSEGSLTESDFVRTGTFVIADGTTHTEPVYRLSITVGGVTLHDIECAVGTDEDTSLLGQSFLRHFSSWSIDNRRGVLKLEAG